MKGTKVFLGGIVAVAMFVTGALAATAISVQKMVKASITADTTSVIAGVTYQFVNNQKTFLHFKRTVADTATVTITTPITVNGLAVADQTFTVDAIDGDKLSGPFPASLFNDGAGDVSFTVDNTVSMTVEIISL